eukprot:gene18839-20735_t
MMPSQGNVSAKKRSPYPFSIAAILGEDFSSTKKHNNIIDHHQGRTNEANGEASQDKQLNSDQSSRTIKNEDEVLNTTAIRFDWLDCTRYKPPKVPRSKRKRGVAAKPSRQPRVPFTPFQQATLENKFQLDHYLTSNAVSELSVVLNLPEQRIKIWFQNRRARERREGQQKTESCTEQ